MDDTVPMADYVPIVDPIPMDDPMPMGPWWTPCHGGPHAMVDPIPIVASYPWCSPCPYPWWTPYP